MKQVPAVRAPENENGNGKANGQFLLGSTVYASPSIRFLQSRAKIWAEAVQSRGGKFTLDSNDPSITHVLVGEGGVNKVPQQLLHRSHTAISDSEEEVPLRGSGPLLVGVKWLEQSLIRGERALERTCHPPAPAVGASTPNAVSRKRSREDVDAALTASEAEVVHRQRWLGDLWHDGCAGMSQTELMLQGVYNVERSERMGNEPVVAALTELHRYERALHEDYFDSEEKGQEVINHRALRYARAASVVRGCAYKVQPDLKGGELPFIGKATAHQINDIIQNGSCATLEAFRHDVEVTDSQGKVRRDSVGGRTRAMFHALPGVGQRTAKAWWNLGLRSYEDVEAAMQPGHPLSAEGPYPISAEQAFSLRHRRDLLESVTPEEIQEMRRVVEEGLAHVSFPGWRVEVVGGAARGKSSHDGDFLVTHPTESIEEVVLPLRDHLIAAGHLFPPGQAMCRVQHGLLPDHIAKIKADHLKDPGSAPGYQTLDRFDHIYGMFRSATGKVRRMDVIIAPADEFGFALLGWIGSRTFLRFQRQHAKDLGMFLNSHALMVKEAGGSYLVPQERPPRRRVGGVGWHPGWSHARAVTKEEEVFELLEIPYRPPIDRNCP